MEFQIDSSTSLNVTDSEIGELLTEVYVDGGFTTPEQAAALFSPPSVRSRGHLICARPLEARVLAGMVIVVPPSSSARRLANFDEAEMHLLAVNPLYRGCGLGRALVRAATDLTQALGFSKIILWTQPSMTTAQRLYESGGFARAPSRDPTVNGRQFLVYTKQW